MVDRPLQLIAMGMIVLSAVLGLAGAPIWLSLIAGLALSSIAILKQLKLRARFVVVGSESLLANTQLASLMNGCLTTAAAWGVGALFRLVLQSMQ